MAHPAEHAALLQRRDFVIPAGVALGDGVRQLLLRYGRWLEALASGGIQPVTPEQERFVRVARGECEPGTEYERAWVNYTKARSASGTEPPGAGSVGPLEVADRLAGLAEARRFAAAVRAEREARRQEVLELVRSRLEEIDAAFNEEQQAADEVVRQREAEVREAVLRSGQSARHEGIQAVYVRGRVTWDSQGLTRYAETHPEVQEFRRVGPPSVSLRYQAEE